VSQEHDVDKGHQLPEEGLHAGQEQGHHAVDQRDADGEGDEGHHAGAAAVHFGQGHLQKGHAAVGKDDY